MGAPVSSRVSRGQGIGTDRLIHRHDGGTGIRAHEGVRVEHVDEGIVAVGARTIGHREPRQRGPACRPRGAGSSQTCGAVRVELVAEFGARSGTPVVLERDTCAALLAEARTGRGAGCSELVCVTVSTGIGGAAMTEGRLILTDGAAEIGHVVSDPTGRTCGCGRRGCLGDRLGTGDRGSRSSEHRRPGSGSTATDHWRLRAGITGAQISAAAAAGDPVASAILDRARDALACAIVNLANTFDPECIIVGGSVADGKPGVDRGFPARGHGTGTGAHPRIGGGAARGAGRRCCIARCGDAAGRRSDRRQASPDQVLSAKTTTSSCSLS